MLLLDTLRVADASHTFLGIDAGDRPGEVTRIGDLINAWAVEGFTVRAVRGDKMRVLSDVFDEFAAAWQFPLYFGQNKDAFNDCMTDLQQPPGRGFVLVLTRPDEVLADAPPRELEWLVRELVSVGAEWATPIELGEWWDRPAVPFHVVLATEGASGAHVVARWSKAGAKVHMAAID